MIYLSILIYDYSHKAHIDLLLVLPMVLLFIYGLLLLRVTDPVPKRFLLERIQIFKVDWTKRSKMIGTMLITVFLIGLSFSTFNYLKYKKVSWFHDIIKITGRIEEVEDQEMYGGIYTNFKLNDMSFTVVRNKSYVSFRNLINQDSLSVYYFENPKMKFNPKKKKTVVKIELIE